MHSVIIICIFIGYFSVLSTAAPQGKGNCNVCGKSGDAGTAMVIGGKIVDHTYAYPWVIGIEIPGDWKKNCSGAIINEYFILTAAHCVADKKEKWKVRFLDNSTGKISKIIPHPRYDNSTYKNDIALLKLQSPIQCDPTIIPICLPAPNTPPPIVGSKMSVNGWGSTAEGHQHRIDHASHDLKEAQLTFMDPKSCEKNAKFDKKFSYCLSGLGVEGVCYGDSGGIGYIDKEKSFLATGVLSFHLSSDCKKNVPAAYTKISDNMDWITKVSGAKPFTSSGD